MTNRLTSHSGSKESVRDFQNTRSIPTARDEHQSSYGAYKLEQSGFSAERPARYCRRDFYKVALIRGENRCHYAEKSIDLSGATLIFFNPGVPYTWEPLSDETGYFCIFKESFFAEGFRKDIKQLPMFAPGCKPAYALSPESEERISSVFKKMLSCDADSAYFFDLSRAYLSEIIYLALDMQPTETLYHHANADTRLTGVFFELLERQFAFLPGQPGVPFRSAKQYAAHLNVHINHLNDAVKKSTGKTTSDHIRERRAIEAAILLKSTALNISEIGHHLGFEEAAHFFNFFKKAYGMSPSDYRKKFNADLPGAANQLIKNHISYQ